MRTQVFSGVYCCPICDDEFELDRASGDELVCPSCDEELEPVEAEAPGGNADEEPDAEDE